jgi:hypothetical protein
MTSGKPRLARPLEVLRAQIDALSPKRSTAWDGWIGDAAHAATKSDHNPNAQGVVNAIDITNDPPHEVHVAVIAEAIRASRDPRLSYMIHNGFMLRSYAKPNIPAWTWVPYTGPSAHEHHLHVSVTAEASLDAKPWRIA